MTTQTLVGPFDIEEVESKSKFAKKGVGYSITSADGTNLYSLSGKRAEYLRAVATGEEVTVEASDDGKGLFLKRIPALEDEESGTGAGVAQRQSTPEGVGVVPDMARERVGSSPAPGNPVPEHSDLDLRIARGVAVKAAAMFMANMPDYDHPQGFFWQLVDDIVDYQFDGLVPGGRVPDQAPGGDESLGGGNTLAPQEPSPASHSGTGVGGALDKPTTEDASPSAQDAPPVPDPISTAEAKLEKAGLLPCKHENTIPAKGPLGAKGWTVCAECGNAFRPSGDAA